DIRTYINLYTALLVPNLVLTGALFFVFGAASRSVMAIYIMGVCLFVGYAASQTLIQSMDNRYIGALLDPFGLAAMRYDARYWTVFEKNTRQITFAGSLLINRSMWVAIAAALLAGGYRTFQFKSSRAGQANKAIKGKGKATTSTPPARQSSRPACRSIQRSLCRFSHRCSVSPGQPTATSSRA
ncbi:MAG: hypothetical protein RLZZ78_1706, partial [Armatimonadota bacterium]